MKVTINAGGREVTVETQSDSNVTAETVGTEALRLWNATDGARPPTEVGFGLTTQPTTGAAAGVKRIERDPLHVR